MKIRRSTLVHGCRIFSANPRRLPDRRTRLLIWGLVLGATLGCDRLDMYDQPRYEPLEQSHFFRDGLSARPPVEGTIARGNLREDQPFYTGKQGDGLAVRIPEAAFQALYDRNPARFGSPFDSIEPAELRLQLMIRGKDRFEIFCSVCHGQSGEGDGIIVRRGFRKPPSFHTDRLREVPNGHFFDVITHGFGAMSSYASRIDAADRWAIVAYLRALQRSQHSQVEDLPEQVRKELSATELSNQIQVPQEEPQE
ncbi:cytochrome c [Schlesneria sp. DSM 10557]|uniref:c-type cytochrome n=1 Tax=Schlesneria sp. DSM 10557 TaxID=3044399 RepID=UPI00359F60F2